MKNLSLFPSYLLRFKTSLHGLCTASLLVFCLLVANVAQADLTVSEYEAAVHDRYAAPGSFLLEPLAGSFGSALSGVARQSNGGGWATLISPSYFLTSAHLHPPVSADLSQPLADSVYQFYVEDDLTGPAEARVVVWGETVAGSDLWLGRFNEPLPATVRTYPIASQTLVSEATSPTSLFVVGQAGATGMRVGLNGVDALASDFSHPSLGAAVGDVFIYDFDPALPGEALVQAGDSGAPSFVEVNGELALAGIHWFQFATDDEPPVLGTGDTLAATYVDAIASRLGGESLRVVSVPETPAWMSVAAAGVGCVIAAVGRRITI
ncbi:MAG: hypothetical protein KDA61_02300 [Planctomycetales bacterium]|nr:hypothetical protein [Planctomycetales bacterium]